MWFSLKDVQRACIIILHILILGHSIIIPKSWGMITVEYFKSQSNIANLKLIETQRLTRLISHPYRKPHISCAVTHFADRSFDTIDNKHTAVGLSLSCNISELGLKALGRVVEICSILETESFILYLNNRNSFVGTAIAYMFINLLIKSYSSRGYPQYNVVCDTYALVLITTLSQIYWCQKNE